MKKVWLLLSLLLAQPVATVIYGVFGDRTPSWVAMIAARSPYLFVLSEALIALAVVVTIFLLSRRFQGQRKHYVCVTRPKDGLANRFRKILTNGEFLHVGKPARSFFEYAQLADYVYKRGADQTPPDGWQQIHLKSLECVLGKHGFYAEVLKNQNATPTVLAFVFRGTDELLDAKSYTPSFLGHLLKNQYRIVQDHSFHKLVNDEIMLHMQGNDFKTIAVGHSLGGGIAQSFAYYASGIKGGKPVSEVYAFHPSPIVGIKSPCKKADTVVNQVFERGEILEYVRALYDESVSVFDTVNVFRFNFSKSRDPVVSHGMRALASGLLEMTDKPVPLPATSEEQADQRRLIYDYIKFHIGLYLATPAVVILLAEGLQVHDAFHFLVGFSLMLIMYAVSGMHAGWFMGETVNIEWEGDNLADFADRAFDPIRRFMHHWMYWSGLLVALSGIGFAKLEHL